MPPSSAAARRPANEDMRVVAAGAAIAGSVSLTQGAGPRGQRQMSTAISQLARTGTHPLRMFDISTLAVDSAGKADIAMLSFS